MFGKDNFFNKLKSFINENNIDTELNIPDHIIAKYLLKNIVQLKDMIRKRDEWFGFEGQIKEITEIKGEK